MENENNVQTIEVDGKEIPLEQFNEMTKNGIKLKEIGNNKYITLTKMLG